MDASSFARPAARKYTVVPSATVVINGSKTRSRISRFFAHSPRSTSPTQPNSIGTEPKPRRRVVTLSPEKQAATRRAVAAALDVGEREDLTVNRVETRNPPPSYTKRSKVDDVLLRAPTDVYETDGPLPPPPKYKE
ncbi:hypothetical protein JCM10212_005585 [Sporobolomyces blumeae]